MVFVLQNFIDYIAERVELFHEVQRLEKIEWEKKKKTTMIHMNRFDDGNDGVSDERTKTMRFVAIISSSCQTWRIERHHNVRPSRSLGLTWPRIIFPGFIMLDSFFDMDLLCYLKAHVSYRVNPTLRWLNDILKAREKMTEREKIFASSR